MASVRYGYSQRLAIGRTISGMRGTYKARKTPQRVADRNSAKYIAWRKAVYKRDNYTCTTCHASWWENNHLILHAHHIKEFAQYPSLRYEVTNGITLCGMCHGAAHHKVQPQLF